MQESRVDPTCPTGLGSLMLNFVVVLFVLGSAIFCFFIAPKIAANIAVEKGLDSGKWFIYGIVFNIFAFVYLYSLLGSGQHAEKRTLLVVVLIYLGIFSGAYLIDKYTVF